MTKEQCHWASKPFVFPGLTQFRGRKLSFGIRNQTFWTSNFAKCCGRPRKSKFFDMPLLLKKVRGRLDFQDIVNWIAINVSELNRNWITFFDELHMLTLDMWKEIIGKLMIRTILQVDYKRYIIYFFFQQYLDEIKSRKNLHILHSKYNKVFHWALDNKSNWDGS